MEYGLKNFLTYHLLERLLVKCKLILSKENMKFKNPMNDYEETVSSSLSWLWCFLFGPIYWAVKGIWRHAVVHLVLAMITAGISHFVYPFFTYKIIRKHYNKIGWTEI